MRATCVCVCVCVCLCVCTHTGSVMSDSLWLEPARLLCPWNFPGKNIGAGCCSLLQGNPPDPGIKPVFLMSPALASGFFTTSTTCKALQHYMCVLTENIPLHVVVKKASKYCCRANGEKAVALPLQPQLEGEEGGEGVCRISGLLCPH